MQGWRDSELFNLDFYLIAREFSGIVADRRTRPFLAMEDAHAAVLRLPLPAELQTLTEKQFSFFGVGIKLLDLLLWGLAGN